MSLGWRFGEIWLQLSAISRSWLRADHSIVTYTEQFRFAQLPTIDRRGRSCACDLDTVRATIRYRLPDRQLQRLVDSNNGRVSTA